MPQRSVLQLTTELLCVLGAPERLCDVRSQGRGTAMQSNNGNARARYYWHDLKALIDGRGNHPSIYQCPCAPAAACRRAICLRLALG